MRRLCLHFLVLILGLIGSGRCRNVLQTTAEGTQTKESVVQQDEPAQRAAGVTFALAKHFQDNMVLQRAPERANIYGFSPDIGKKIIAQMNTPSKQYDYTTVVTAGSTAGVGVWKITLDPLKAGVTVTIKVVSDRGTLNLKNVIFGDVWICSGQSNMQFNVFMMSDAAAQTADAHNYPNIRLMTVSMRNSTFPLDDLVAIDQAWTSPNSGAMGRWAWDYFSAVCWVFGKQVHRATGVPVGLIASDWGGTPLNAWSSPESLQKCRAAKATSRRTVGAAEISLPVSDSPNSPPQARAFYVPRDDSVLWNSMIYPLLGMTLRGAIWYQGETDADGGTKMNIYNCTFPGMIADWREKFSQVSQQTNPLFPFGFVQLAPNAPQPPYITVGFPDIRWHQTADYGYVPNPKMPNVFMAVTLDLPGFNSTYGPTHPQDKADVGARLALSGLSVAYNQKTFYQGPFPRSGAPSSSGYVLDYGSTWKLVVRSQDVFEFFCERKDGSYGKWVVTSSVASNSTSITLKSDVCGNDEKIMGVRYAWRTSPCTFKKCAVYSTVNSLPAPPFVFKAKAGENEVKFSGPFGDGRLEF
ncbi:sialate O-acetylesterase isoform X1 [Aplysia californica]|uniref:Sialate O-acetylesterase isoform X1 n=1 Tax=Aplysia californica TaxID=6500 RepID=A0ABM0K1G8_APLCA|nr:sialate O-acetylesterase isoform X1 [Aplysia californica]